MSDDPKTLPEDHPLRADSDFRQGYRDGWKFIDEVDEKKRVAVGPQGEIVDLVELQAAGFIPDDLQQQIEERIPPQARFNFELGLVTAAQDFLTRGEPL